MEPSARSGPRSTATAAAGTTAEFLRGSCWCASSATRPYGRTSAGGRPTGYGTHFFDVPLVPALLIQGAFFAAFMLVVVEVLRRRRPRAAG